MGSVENMHTTFLSLTDFQRERTIESSIIFPYTEEIQSILDCSTKMGTTIQYQSREDLIHILEEIGQNGQYQLRGSVNILQDIIGLLLSKDNDIIDLEHLDAFCIGIGNHTLLCLRNYRENRMYPGISAILGLNNWRHEVYLDIEASQSWNNYGSCRRVATLIFVLMLSIFLFYSTMLE
jgi:hypothetical protein